MHNDGENFTLNSLSNEFPTATIQSATDCFRLGRTINHFPRLCLPSTQSLSSVKDSQPTYSSINSLNTNEDDNAFDETSDNEDDAAIDDDEDILPDILSQNLTVEEYQKHQLPHKKTPRNVEIYDEHGSPVTYRSQHVDNPNDTSSDFYTIHCQQGNDKKLLRFYNDGENFTLNSLSNEFSSTAIQSATNCFRPGKTMNHLRRLCLTIMQSMSSVEGSEATYSSIISLKNQRRRWCLGWTPWWWCWWWCNHRWRRRQPNMWNKHTCRPLQIVHSQSSSWRCPGKIDASLAKKTAHSH